VALCDQKIDICASDLPAHSKVKISVSLRLPWANDVLYESTAWFMTDADGKVDLSRQKPVSGSYDYIDPMGLIDSVRSQDPKALEKIARNISVDKSIFIDITAECGSELASVKLERLMKTPEIKSQRITDDFVGELFYSDCPDNKTIVWLGGSGSGLSVNAPVAAALASHGFNVLSLPFFGEKGLPSQLSKIPLEYFERVFTWLQKNPITHCKEVQILGMSKGAELALILASKYPFITKMVLWAPHAYCFQGLAYKNESSWTYAGIDLPFIRGKNWWIVADMLRCFIKNEPFGFTPVYKKALAIAKNKPEARIKVENACADLLMITSRECGMWNTYDGSLEIMDTLRKSNYPYHYDLIVYEHAGEPFYVPYVIPASESSVKIAPRLMLSMGGTLEGNARAKVDAWERTIQFFAGSKT
jgi:dienelactone hydrolase